MYNYTLSTDMPSGDCKSCGPGLLVFLVVLSKLKKPKKTMSPVHRDLSFTVNYINFVKGDWQKAH